MRSYIILHSLTSQLIGRFVLVVVITAIIAGLPGHLILGNQLDRQAWSRVEQAALNMEVLYSVRQNELLAFAKLISHQSCLQEQVLNNDKAGCLEKLEDLIQGTEIKLVVLCDLNHQVLVSTLNLPVTELCSNVKEKGFFVIPDSPTPQVWVVGSHMIGEHESFLGWSVAGIPANDALANTIHFQSGLEYSILYQNQPIVTSLDAHGLSGREIFIDQIPEQENQGTNRRTFELLGQPYYAVRQSLDGNADLDYEVALSVADIFATQQQMRLNFTGTILIVIVLGSLMGILLSRSISQPLQQLTQTAVNFSSGDLDTPVTVDNDLTEVSLVAKALEEAREKLSHSMSELRQQRSWTQHLLDSIVEGILTLDKDGRITFFSRGAEKITGWSREQVFNRPVDEIFKLEDPNTYFSQILPTSGKESKVLVELADGRWATLSITGASLTPSNSDSAEIAVVFRDVSDEEIIHRRLGYFMANVTHEFRTPLAALAASSELLLDQMPDIQPADLEQLLVSLHLSILRLQTLIDNLIESASIEAGHFRVSPHPTSLHKIIADASNTMNPLLVKYGQRLQIDLPDTLPLVNADARRTVQVLVNLLSNASKFSPTDSNINLRAWEKNGYVRVAVTDQGPGISAEQRGDLFRRFRGYGAQTINSKSGTGLGLSVVKAIVEAQTGQTGVEDRAGGGSSFWFTLKSVENECES